MKEVFRLVRSLNLENCIKNSTHLLKYREINDTGTYFLLSAKHDLELRNTVYHKAVKKPYYTRTL